MYKRTTGKMSKAMSKERPELTRQSNAFTSNNARAEDSKYSHLLLLTGGAVLAAISSVKADAASEIAALKTAANEVAKVNLLTDQDVSYLGTSTDT